MVKEKGAGDSSLFTTFKRQIANTKLVNSDRKNNIQSSSRVSVISENPEADKILNSQLSRFAAPSDLIDDIEDVPIPVEQFTSEVFIGGFNGLNNPRGITINSTGKLYISDTGNGRILSFVQGDTEYTELLTELSEPTGLAIDSNGTLYIAETGNGRILSFVQGDTEYTELLTGLSAPTGIAFDSDGNLYIANSGAGKIVKYTSPTEIDYNFIVGLNNPIGIAVGSNNCLYIAESGSNQIKKTTQLNVAPVATDINFEGFDRPSWITFDQIGNLYIVHRGGSPNSRIARIKVAGSVNINYISPNQGLLEGISVDSNGHLIFIGSDHDSIYRISPNAGFTITIPPSNNLFSMSAPKGIALDSNNKLYIVDSGNQRIVKSNSSGTEVDFFFLDSRVRSPTGILIDSSNTIYVIDSYAVRQRISAYYPNGTINYDFITGIDSATGLAKSSDTLYVFQAGKVSTYNATTGAVINVDFLTGLSSPQGIAILNDTIYLCYSGKVLRYENEFGTDFISGLNDPRGIALYDSKLYVSEFGAGRISTYDAVTGSVLNANLVTGVSPVGLAFDSTGNLYFADYTSNSIIRYGQNSEYNYLFNFITDLSDANSGLVVSRSGDTDTLYASDTGNNRILQKVGTANPTTLLAGLSSPKGITLDSSNNLYIVDSGNQRIIKRTSGGDVDYLFMDTRTNNSSGIVFDASNNLYVVDPTRDRVVAYYNNGTIDYNFITGLNGPRGIALFGNVVYVADTGNNKVVQMSMTGEVTDFITGLNAPIGLVADFSSFFVSQSGKVSKYDSLVGYVINEDFITGLNDPRGIALYDFKLYVSEFGAGRISTYDADTGSVLNVNLVTEVSPVGLAFDSNGYLYFADYTSNSIMRYRDDVVSTNNTFITGLSNANSGLVVSRSGDTDTLYASDTGNNRILQKVGTADPTTLLAGLSSPKGITLDSSNNLYIVDSGNQRIIKRTSGGDVDYLFMDTRTNNPEGIVFDSANNLYVVDPTRSRVILYYNDGTIDYNFITGLNGPRGIALLGNVVYVTDTGHDRVIRKIGSATPTIFIDGLNAPTGIAVSGTTVYVADTGSDRVIQKIGSADPTDFITGLNAPTGIAVSGTTVYVAVSGDNKLIRKVGGDTPTDFIIGLNGPTGITLSGTTLYVADTGNNRIVYAPTDLYLLPITPPDYPTNIAISGSTMYVHQPDTGIISTYNTATGNVIQPEFIGGVYNTSGIAQTGSTVYVVDRANNKILKKVGSGEPTNFITNMNIPSGIAISSSSIYISEYGRNRVIKLPVAYNRYSQTINPASTPSAVAVSSSRIYVCQATSITMYNITTGVGTTNFITGLSTPQGIAVVTTGSTDIVFVADTGNNRIVQKTTANGATQAVVSYSLSPPLSAPRGIAVVIYGGGLYTIFVTDRDRVTQKSGGATPTIFIDGLNAPTGIATSGGSIYVVDTGNNRVIRKPPGDPPIDFITGLSSPRGIAIGTTIYVADTGNNRIIQKIGSSAFTEFRTGLNNPRGIALNGSNLYIANTGEGALLVDFTDVITGLNGPTDLAVTTNAGGVILYIVNEGSNTVVRKVGTNIATNLITRSNPLKGIAVTQSDNGIDTVYVGETNKIIRKVWNGAVTEFINTGLNSVSSLASSGTTLYVSDSGNANITVYPYSIPVTSPSSITFNSDGALYLSGQNGIQQYQPGVLSDGVVSLSNPTGITLDSSGNMYISSTGNGSVWRRDTTSGIVDTLFTQGLSSPTALVAVEDKLYCLQPNSVRELISDVLLYDESFNGIAVDNGNLYLTDGTNGKILRRNISSGETVDFATGLTNPSAITVINGEAYYGISGGNAIASRQITAVTDTYLTGLNSPTQVAFNSSGVLYISDEDNLHQRIGENLYDDGVAMLNNPTGITLDSNGHMYVSSTGSGSIWSRHTTTEIVDTGFQHNLDNPTALVAFEDKLYCLQPNSVRELINGDTLFDESFNGIAVDNGNLYITDATNGKIIRHNISTEETVDFASGLTNPSAITVINGDAYYMENSTRVNAYKQVNVTDTYLTGLNSPTQIAFNSSGVLYICNQDSVKKYEPYLLSDGVAMLKNPTGITLDTSGNMYISSTGSEAIWKRDTTTGIVDTVFRQAVVYPTALVAFADKLYYIDPNSVRELINDVNVLVGVFNGIAVDNGNLYITDATNGKIIRRNISSGATVDFATGLTNPSAIAVINGNVYVYEQGTGKIKRKLRNGGFTDFIAGLSDINGLATDSDDRLLISDTGNNRMLTASQMRLERYNIAQLYMYVPGTLNTHISLVSPRGVTVRGDQLYVVDSDLNVIYVINKITGVLSVTYGTGITGNSDEAGALEFNTPYNVAVDSTGNIFVADNTNNLIRRINFPGGDATTIAGGGGSTDTTGGTATSKLLNQPSGVAVYGNILYFSNTGSNNVCKVEGGNISNLAGTYSAPEGVAVDSVGNVYVANTGLNKITKVTPTNLSSDIALPPDTNPRGVAVDSSGQIYISDGGNNRVIRLNTDATVTVVAESLLAPRAVTVDTDGTIYVADSLNDSIVKIRRTFV